MSIVSHDASIASRQIQRWSLVLYFLNGSYGFRGYFAAFQVFDFGKNEIKQIGFHKSDTAMLLDLLRVRKLSGAGYGMTSNAFQKTLTFVVEVRKFDMAKSRNSLWYVRDNGGSVFIVPLLTSRISGSRASQTSWS